MQYEPVVIDLSKDEQKADWFTKVRQIRTLRTEACKKAWQLAAECVLPLIYSLVGIITVLWRSRACLMHFRRLFCWTWKFYDSALLASLTQITQMGQVPVLQDGALTLVRTCGKHTLCNRVCFPVQYNRPR